MAMCVESKTLRGIGREFTLVALCYVNIAVTSEGPWTLGQNKSLCFTLGCRTAI